MSVGLTSTPYYAAVDVDCDGGIETMAEPERKKETELRELLLDHKETRIRKSSMNLKHKLKQVREEFSSERRVVADAFIDSSNNKPHYVKEEYCNDLLVRARLRLLRRVDSLPVRLFGLLILIADTSFIIIDVALKSSTRAHQRAEVSFQILDLLFSAYFCVEVSLRIVGLGWVYFRRWFEIVDLVIVVMSIFLTVTYILLPDDGKISSEQSMKLFGPIRLFVIGRVIRVFFWARVVHEHKGIKRFFRNKVSQNKRRYIDAHYDLDLTYVTDRVIAMSFPSSGSESIYRNSIKEVGEFLDKKHFGHYRVYNLCSEREYDTSYFHNQVQRILIDDHNVPRFTDLVDFCEDVYTWMEANPENVIVVHCKGGKGRTGTMISAWLVRAGLFPGADESLAYFSDRRTDKSRGNKSQGVQTPSQSRYVLYYEKLLMDMSGTLPPPTYKQLKKIILHGLCSVGKGDGTDWMFEILQVNEKIFEYSFQNQDMQHIKVNKNSVSDCIEVIFLEETTVILYDDVKFKFYCTTRSMPTATDKCQFYFWFNTTFIEDNKLSLDRSELDNIQKSRIQRHYPKYFAVELEFQTWSDSS